MVGTNPTRAPSLRALAIATRVSAMLETRRKLVAVLGIRIRL